MQVQQLIEQFAREQNIAGFALNEYGCAALQVKQGYTLNFEWNESRALLHLYATLGPVPAGDKERVYRQLLEANLYGMGSGGAVLALDGSQEAMVLCQWLDIEGRNARTLAAVVEQFLDAVDHWLEQIQMGRLGTSAAQEGGRSWGEGVAQSQFEHPMAGMMLRA